MTPLARTRWCCVAGASLALLAVVGAALFSSLDANAQEPPVLCAGLPVTVDLSIGAIPTSGRDVILGTEGADSIAAGEGDDVICSLGGDDKVWGQGGNDQIDGGDGNDFLRGGDGDDDVAGGSGADDIAGGRDNDLLIGGVGSDKIRGGTGDDVISGGAGDDVLLAGNGGSDLIEGGAGNDALITGGPRPDRLLGGPGNDLLRGHKGADEIYGDGGDDFLAGGPQSDLLDGGDGTDECYGGEGTNTNRSCENLTPQVTAPAECVVGSGGATVVSDFAAMRASGVPVGDLNRSRVDGEATAVRTVFDLPESRMRWGAIGVELGVDVADSLAVDFEYRAELRERVIDQAIPVGTTQAYCMRFDVLELPDLFGPVTIFQRFNRDVDGPDISVELTGANQFSNAVSNDLQVVAFGERLRIGDMLDGSNTLLVAVYNGATDGAYKVVLNGRVLAEASGIDTVGSRDGGWVQFGLYPHGFYGDAVANANKADQIGSGSTEVRIEYIDFALTSYAHGGTDLAAFGVDPP